VDRTVVGSYIAAGCFPAGANSGHYESYVYGAVTGSRCGANGLAASKIKILPTFLVHPTPGSISPNDYSIPSSNNPTIANEYR
jgi:hypothetical protein